MPDDTEDLLNCPNCGADIKEGILFSNLFLSDNEMDVINLYQEGVPELYCEKCGKDSLEFALEDLYEERTYLQAKLQELIDTIPVITTSTPHLWEYEVVGMVTGQSTTGTGVFSDFYSSITDLFGMQSNSYNKKLKGGEDLCYAQVRLQAVKLGGNAVIATDIDYSEVGVEKGMLMVCMAGTAIKLRNTNILGDKIKNNVEEITFCSERLSLFAQLLDTE